ncbi:MAG: hypothetical protein CFE31_17430 [Rhizobiales bacterium PAR1]|nr:MAG: hypothetical protein CFE31_17430 [Rhizobiales bacterium PAR1]
MANHRDGDAELVRRGGGLAAKKPAGKAGHVRRDKTGQVIDKRSSPHGGSSSSGTRIFRCAVYTRKSSEEGLEQDFNSLHAQREACEAYIASQRHEGWKAITTRYDDGGYSGGTMERPGLDRLLADIASGMIDIVVVYKVDRLTRALADFAKIVEIFDARGVSFVSVTQSFNTTTSMGRLTLNVLLSFAQFEREVTAERIRDKIAASKKKGIFMGGRVPMGYRVENRKLHIVPEQAEMIRTIFEVYLAIRSTIGAARVLTERGILTQVHVAKDGSSVGGIPFAYGSLQWVLRNRIYVGEISHKGEYYPGEHEAIIDRVTFDKVQALLTSQRSSPTRTSHKMRSLLTSKIYDSNGNRMAPSHSNKRGLRYRYYVSRALLDGAPDKAGKPARIPAIAIETLVTEALRKEQHANSQTGLNDQRSGKAGVMQQKRPDASGAALADHSLESNHNDAHRLVETMLEHVEVYENRVVVTLIPEDREHNRHSGAESSTAWANGETANHDEATARSGRPHSSPRQIVIPCTLGQQPLVKEVIASQGTDATTSKPNLPNSQRRNRARLIEAIHRARTWLDELHTGKTESLEVIANREGRSMRNVSMMLNLAFLAPKIIESILADKMPVHLSASHIAQNLPLDWEDQQRWISAQV